MEIFTNLTSCPVCGNYYNSDIRNLRTARTHCGKRSVTRCIYKGNLITA